LTCVYDGPNYVITALSRNNDAASIFFDMNSQMGKPNEQWPLATFPLSWNSDHLCLPSLLNAWHLETWNKASMKRFIRISSHRKVSGSFPIYCDLKLTMN
jgi:hypothetical protein